ncbi:MAG TPA: oxygenase MpaB family protein [Nocardioides sp.]|nr:oxygenase MpaB family protein [Nocardioides sp.]
MSRRRILVGGTALGALGAVQLASAPAGWSWSSSGSIAGGTTTTDPNTVWDDPADWIAAAVLGRGGVAEVNAALATWVTNADAVPGAAPSDVADFIATARQLPSWADQAQLDRAAQFNKDQGDVIAVLYGMGSGMMSCLIPHEARAVYYSRGGATMKDRIAKTAKLGYDIGAVDAYRPAGSMVVTAVKTRLVHAAVRTLLPQSAYWTPTADQSRPISQRDLLITWHSLASFVMANLEKWKVPVSAADKAAYLHLWQVSAHLLGIQDQFIPATWEDAYAQKAQLLDPVIAPTSEGLKLAQILINLGSDADGGFLSKPMLQAMTRYVLGGTYADMLAIPRQPLLDASIAAGWPGFIAMREAGLNLPLMGDLYNLFDEFLRQGALFYLSSGQRIDIVMPDANRQSF